MSLELYHYAILLGPFFFLFKVVKKVKVKLSM
jgi:hypothetical protein